MMTFGPGLLSTIGIPCISLFGECFLISIPTGERHRKQRKMMNPVFSVAHMRRMMPIFYRICLEVRHALSIHHRQN